jgi:hypothetical protein
MLISITERPNIRNVFELSNTGIVDLNPLETGLYFLEFFVPVLSCRDAVGRSPD